MTVVTAEILIRRLSPESDKFIPQLIIWRNECLNTVRMQSDARKIQISMNN